MEASECPPRGHGAVEALESGGQRLRGGLGPGAADICGCCETEVWGVVGIPAGRSAVDGLNGSDMRRCRTNMGGLGSPASACSFRRGHFASRRRMISPISGVLPGPSAGVRGRGTGWAETYAVGVALVAARRAGGMPAPLRHSCATWLVDDGIPPTRSRAEAGGCSAMRPCSGIAPSPEPGNGESPGRRPSQVSDQGFPGWAILGLNQ